MLKTQHTKYLLSAHVAVCVCPNKLHPRARFCGNQLPNRDVHSGQVYSDIKIGVLIKKAVVDHVPSLRNHVVVLLPLWIQRIGDATECHFLN